MASTVIFLTTTGASTWTVPSDWTSVNKIECLAGGAGGGVASAGNTGGPGGGGGTYSTISNISASTLGGIGANVNIGVGAAGVADGAGGDTWFNATSLANAITNGNTVSCGAQHGSAHATAFAGGLGGLFSASVGASGNNGGNGGTAVHFTTQASGGGGAGGPNGAGAVSSNSATNGSNVGGQGGGGADGGSIGAATTTGTGGAGGANGVGGGSGGAGGASSGSSGSVGVAGTGESTWTSTPGAVVAGPAGGGGGGGSAPSSDVPGNGGAGGPYGGGGGGGGNNAGGTAHLGAGGVGGQGIIVITYTPATSSTPSLFWGSQGESALRKAIIDLDQEVGSSFLPPLFVPTLLGQEQEPIRSRLRVEVSPSSFVPIPATLPPAIGGMAWQRQVEQFIARQRNEPPPISMDFSEPVVVSGMAWHKTFEPLLAKTKIDSPGVYPLPTVVSVAVTGVAWQEQDDIQPLAKPKIDSPYSLVFEPVTVSGISWAKQVEQFTAKQRNEPPPAAYVEPPWVGIFGMAWGRQVEQFVAKSRIESAGSYPLPASITVGIMGHAWLPSFPGVLNRPLFDWGGATLAPPLPMVTVMASSSEEYPLTPSRILVRDDHSEPFFQSTKTIPPQISGMAWWRQVEQFTAKQRIEPPPPAFLATPTTVPTPISGNGWSTAFEQSYRLSLVQPADTTGSYVPFAGTLPAVISGMAWQRPFEGVLKPSVVQAPIPPSGLVAPVPTIVPWNTQFEIKPLLRQVYQSDSFWQLPPAFQPLFVHFEDAWRPVRSWVDSPPSSYVPIPSTVPPMVSGMAWRGEFQYPVRTPVAQPADHTKGLLPPLLAVGVSGFAWIVQVEQRLKPSTAQRDESKFTYYPPLSLGAPWSQQIEQPLARRAPQEESRFVYLSPPVSFAWRQESVQITTRARLSQDDGRFAYSSPFLSFGWHSNFTQATRLVHSQAEQPTYVSPIVSQAFNWRSESIQRLSPLVRFEPFSLTFPTIAATISWMQTRDETAIKRGGPQTDLASWLAYIPPGTPISGMAWHRPFDGILSPSVIEVTDRSGLLILPVYYGVVTITIGDSAPFVAICMDS